MRQRETVWFLCEFLMDAEIPRILATSNKTTDIARFLEDPDQEKIQNPLVAC